VSHLRLRYGDAVRADAERSTARILEAAEKVLADDANASLEKIADAAGLARATVHRRFASRKALIDALSKRFNDRYRHGIDQARVGTAPPLVALHRLTESAFEVKTSYRLVIDLNHGPDDDVLAGIDLLFARLHETGVITAAQPTWCRKVYLALLHEVHLLPADAAELADGGDEVGSRSALLIRSVLGALGGRP
jgi:AcrR family transcriptional regulator